MSYQEVIEILKNELEPFEFECHPFKVEWYNSTVDPKFKFNDLHSDTLSVLVVSKPLMFEKLFLPFIFNRFKNNAEMLESLSDPIDNCMSEIFARCKEKLLNYLESGNVEIEVIKDFEMTPGTHRPRVIMQTCAHISGAAFYYDRKLIESKIEPEFSSEAWNCLLERKKNLMGVCLHPNYGGWFAMRCVFIFKNLTAPDLVEQKPVDSLRGDLNGMIDLISKFNLNWKDWSYRDVISVKCRYSHLQKEYFLTEPRFRKDLLEKWLSHASVNSLCQTYQDTETLKLIEQNYLKDNFFILN